MPEEPRHEDEIGAAVGENGDRDEWKLGRVWAEVGHNTRDEAEEGPERGIMEPCAGSKAQESGIVESCAGSKARQVHVACPHCCV